MDEKIIQESAKINEKVSVLLTKYEKETRIFNEITHSLKTITSKLDEKCLLKIDKPKKVIIFSQTSVYSQKMNFNFEEKFLLRENEEDLDLGECQDVFTINLDTLLSFKFDNLINDEVQKKLNENFEKSKSYSTHSGFDWTHIIIFIDIKSEYVGYFIDIIRNFNGRVYNLYLKEIYDIANRKKHCEDYMVFITELRKFFYIYECIPIYVQINNIIMTIPKEIDDDLVESILMKENYSKLPTEYLIININE